MGAYETPLLIPNPPDVEGDASTEDKTPTWTWTSAGGTGSGTFRIKLDSNDFMSDYTETTDERFTPASALSIGDHTLYVQECNALGEWSESGSMTITIKKEESSAGGSSPVSYIDRYGYGGNVYGGYGISPSVAIYGLQSFTPYSLNTPSFGISSFSPMSFGVTSFGTTNFGGTLLGAYSFRTTPSFGVSSFSTNLFGAPSYGLSSFSTPSYGTYSFNTPSFAMPAFGGGGYGFYSSIGSGGLFGYGSFFNY